MSVSSLLIALLWCVGVLAALTILLPLVLTLVGLTRYRNRIDENTAALEPADSDLSYAATYRELIELGFRPLGTCSAYVSA